MPNEPLARTMTPPPAAPSEDDYQAFCAVLSESGRGRAFLAEYARRNRHADTEALLAAIERIEARLRADASAVQRLRDDLRMLLIAIRLTRPEIDAAGPATKAAKLAALLDLLERRIDAMAEARPAELAPPADEALGAQIGVLAMPDEPEPARAQLAVVPPADEPELPIPSPASVQAAPISLVARAAMMPEVSFVEDVPPAPAIVETVAAEPAAQPASPPPDPLAAIMALSEDERLALFT